jgi:hypothetical protein
LAFVAGAERELGFDAVNRKTHAMIFSKLLLLKILLGLGFGLIILALL